MKEMLRRCCHRPQKKTILCSASRFFLEKDAEGQKNLNFARTTNLRKFNTAGRITF